MKHNILSHLEYMSHAIVDLLAINKSNTGQLFIVKRIILRDLSGLEYHRVILAVQK